MRDICGSESLHENAKWANVFAIVFNLKPLLKGNPLKIVTSQKKKKKGI